MSIYYPTILTLHIIAAVIWLSFFVAEPVLKQMINKGKGGIGERKLILAYLALANVSGMIGMTGVVVTGVLLVFYWPNFGFFDFSTAHWLASKQILTVVLMVIVGAYVIPNGIKIKKLILKDLSLNLPLSDELYANVKKLSRVLTIGNYLILLNFLFAITRRFYGG